MENNRREKVKEIFSLRLPQEEYKKFLKETANLSAAEEKLELTFLLSGKCCIGGYFFQAPSLGSFLLLEEWESPFLFPSPNGGRKGKICMQDLFLALYVLEEPGGAAAQLLKWRTQQYFHRRKKMAKIPYGELEKIRRKYSSLDPEQAAEELSVIFHLHTALDMLPEKVSCGRAPAGEERSRMERISDLLFFSRNILPAFSFEEILWGIPYAFLGYLLLRECRKQGMNGIGKEEASQKLWKLFSKHLEKQKL